MSVFTRARRAVALAKRRRGKTLTTVARRRYKVRVEQMKDRRDRLTRRIKKVVVMLNRDAARR